jgi:hypothetical protein
VTLSHPDVARVINEKFVPVWETIRPVPKVTIEFGDGRVLKRTLAGNTVISVCLPDGRVVDAFPGVYTPKDFLQQVQPALVLAEKLSRYPGGEDLAQWHRQQVTSVVKEETIRTTLSKTFVESPLLSALGLGRPVGKPRAADGAQGLAALTPDPLADPKAALAALSARIEDLSKQPASAEQLRAKYAKTPESQRPSPEKLGQMAVQMDSQTNVRLVRPAVHLLLSAYSGPPDAREVRDAIYKQVLHVPVDDPYLGLADALVPGSPAGQ